MGESGAASSRSQYLNEKSKNPCQQNLVRDLWKHFVCFVLSFWRFLRGLEDPIEILVGLGDSLGSLGCLGCCPRILEAFGRSTRSFWGSPGVPRGTFGSSLGILRRSLEFLGILGIPHGTSVYRFWKSALSRYGKHTFGLPSPLR